MNKSVISTGLLGISLITLAGYGTLSSDSTAISTNTLSKSALSSNSSLTALMI